MSKFPKEKLIQARNEYLENHNTPPEQFNIRRVDGEFFAEFHPDETCWNEGFTRWFSGGDALDLFFSLDESKVFEFGTWNTEWDCKTES